MHSARWVSPSTWKTSKRTARLVHTDENTAAEFCGGAFLFLIAAALQLLQFLDGPVEDIEVDVDFFAVVPVELPFVGILAERPARAVRQGGRQTVVGDPDRVVVDALEIPFVDVGGRVDDRLFAVFLCFCVSFFDHRVV